MMQPLRWIWGPLPPPSAGGMERGWGSVQCWGEGAALRATHRYCPPVSERYISSTDSFLLLLLEGLRGEGVSEPAPSLQLPSPCCQPWLHQP